MSAHNLCFEQKYEKYQNFLSEKLSFLVVKCSVYLNRHVFVMLFFLKVLSTVRRKLSQLNGKFAIV